MRPIPALIALACVAGLLLVGLLFWTSSKSDPVELDPVARLAREAAQLPGAELADAPDATVPDRQVEVAPDTAITAARPGPPPAGKERRVSGRVVDMAGQPVANATVYAAAGDGDFDGPALDEIEPDDTWFRRADTKTDAQGRFALDPRIEAQVRLAVRAPGFAPLDLERTISATTPDVGDLVLLPGVVLEGRVVDHAGRPVAGAELRRRRTGASPFAFFGGQGGAVVAKSDSAGAFRADTMPVGPWTLRVTSEIAPDKDESGETARPGEVVRGITIQLEEGFEIAGHVTGAPAAELPTLRVAAAMVRGDTGRGDMGGEAMVIMGGSQRTAPIAADGSFVVRGCRKDAKYRLSVRQESQGARGLGSMMRSPTRSAPADATAGERGVQIAYRSETALSFQVVNAATGKPITKMAIAAGSRWPAPLMDEKNRKVREFPEGRVRYGALRTGGGPGRGGPSAAPSTFTLQVEAQGFLPYEKKDLTLVEGRDNDLGVIRLEPTRVVKVEVRSLSTGAPIVGARVSLEEVTDRPSDNQTFSFSMGGGDGEMHDMGGGDSHRDVTNAEGRALVSSFPGSRGRLRVTHKEFAESLSDPIALPLDQDLDRAVTLSAGGGVVVLVADAAGKAVVGQSIEHRRPGAVAMQMLFGGNDELTSDAEGRVTLTHLEPGLHGFRLAGDGGARMFGGGGAAVVMSRSFGEDEQPAGGEPWVEIDVTEGGAHEVRLVAPERARVFGRVREGGRPLAGASVTLREKGGNDMPFFDQGPKAEADGLGEFALENVAAGDYVMVVSHTGRAMDHEVEVRVRAGENRQDVDLSLSIVEGRVTDSEGKPVAGIRIRAERVSGGEETVREFMFAIDSGDGPVSFGSGGGGQVTTNAEGRYKLRGVQPDVDLVVVATGTGVQRTQSDKVKVPVDGTRSNVDLVLAKGATIEVTCRRPDGSPATPCEVRAELQETDDADSKVEITRGDGKARFQGLKPGRWRVSARDLTADDEDGPAPAEQTVDVVVGPPHQVTLEVRGS